MLKNLKQFKGGTKLNLTIIELRGKRVLTTEQLAEVYETDVKNIQMNFSRNQKKFTENVHYFLLTGDKLRSFKNQVTNSGLVGKNASSLYLWTDRGASRHCKILDTDKAWEQFDNLEDTYFKAKELIPQLNNLSPQLQTLIHLEMEQNRIKEEINEVKSEVQGIRDVVAINTSNWRKDTNNILNKIAQKLGGFDAYQQVRQESYESLEARGKCKLSIRLTNMKREMLENGQPKSKVEKVSKLDVIDRDTRLLEIYTAIVKEMAIKYGVGIASA